MREQPFYIGQKVVALKTRSSEDGFRVTKDTEYTILGIHQCASCKAWKVNVGIAVAHQYTNSLCGCGAKTKFDGFCWAAAALFAPIQENFQAITFEKVMEAELTSVN